jgi:formate hydrogenlyase subunit 6/NADH:ubiquinone oxidoreductase subunit I
MLALNSGLCVRSLSVDSACNKCELICPTHAIEIGEKTLPSINFASCVECGACHGVCPSEALKLDTFDATEFFFSFLDAEESLISCRKNVPCIAALSVEHIISLAVLKKELVLDVGHCKECEIATTCHAQILKNQEEASYLLEAMQNSAEIRLEELCYEEPELEKEVDRRDFLRAMNLKTVAKTKHQFEQEVQKATDELVEHELQSKDIALLRKKHLPQKRKIFFTAMKRVTKPSTYHVVDANEVSFTSYKNLDAMACTACQMCYRVCPTGALSSDVKNSKIDFDPFMCIKCHICHDVCAPNAITLAKGYPVQEFFEPKVVNLVSFAVRRCDECNAVFSTNTNEKLCYRCKIEEEEARELWGISDDM